MIAKGDIYVNVRKFIAAHGHEPRGFGSWAFQITEAFDVLWCHGMTYSQAKRVALKRAQSSGSYEVIVLP